MVQEKIIQDNILYLKDIVNRIDEKITNYDYIECQSLINNLQEKFLKIYYRSGVDDSLHCIIIDKLI